MSNRRDLRQMAMQALYQFDVVSDEAIDCFGQLDTMGSHETMKVVSLLHEATVLKNLTHTNSSGWVEDNRLL